MKNNLKLASPLALARLARFAEPAVWSILAAASLWAIGAAIFAFGHAERLWTTFPDHPQRTPSMSWWGGPPTPPSDITWWVVDAVC